MRIPKLDPRLEKMAKEEHKEHPWTTISQSRQIALDHDKKHKTR